MKERPTVSLDSKFHVVHQTGVAVQAGSTAVAMLSHACVKSTFESGPDSDHAASGAGVAHPASLHEGCTAVYMKGKWRAEHSQVHPLPPSDVK